MSDGFATPLPSLSKPQPGKLGAVRGLVPGLLLCGAVTLAVTLLQVAEERLFGRAWLEALVLAILDRHGSAYGMDRRRQRAAAVC